VTLGDAGSRQRSETLGVFVSVCLCLCLWKRIGACRPLRGRLLRSLIPLLNSLSPSLALSLSLSLPLSPSPWPPLTAPPSLPLSFAPSLSPCPSHIARSLAARLAHTCVCAPLCLSTTRADGEEAKRFYLQYSFPPSCVGECGRIGGIGRREIGHGNLAERGLLPVIPSEDEFPYTIRLESLITESCGSSSMGSVCAGCLALYDAGVPLKKAVAGVAMGLLLPENLKRGNEDDKASIMKIMEEEAVILTDILGLEDALGTMDFKVCGDAKGISAFQLDIKCEGLSTNLLNKALLQAKEGRLHMLFHMLKAQPKPADQLAPSVPKMTTITIPQSAIGKIIGPGGSNIRSMIEEFQLTNIDIQEVGSDGLVTISSKSAENNAKAEDKVRFLVQEAANFSPNAPGGSKTVTRTRRAMPEPEVGKVYEDCTVMGVHPFGCFVELFPGKEGLVHVSELSDRRIDNVEEEFKVGDKIPVKVPNL